MIKSNKEVKIDSEEHIENEQTIADIVDDPKDKEILEPVKINPIGFVNDMVYLRKEPNKNASIIAILHKGDTVAINSAGSTSSFYYVTAISTIGYIEKEYVTV